MLDRSPLPAMIGFIALLSFAAVPAVSWGQSAPAPDGAPMLLRAGPVSVAVPGHQGWTRVSEEPGFAGAIRAPRVGHSLDLSVREHPVSDPWSAILLAKQPRVAVEPYLIALRNELATPQMPEVYFEAIPIRLARRHCLFFQSISDEGESTNAGAGTRVLRSIGAFCALPRHDAVLELRMIGLQPTPTDNYEAFSADMEAVFETLSIE